MQISIIAQDLDGPPVFVPNRYVTDLTHRTTLTTCVVEKGMTSGEPSVIICSQGVEGTVYLQTSLDKFLTAASGMMAMAETRWGWKRPEGSFTILPPDKETRKTLLETIKKELEEWSDE